MKKLLSNLGNSFEHLPARLRQRKILVWILFILFAGVIAAGLPKNKMDMTLDSWFSKDDPTKLALNHFKSLFGSDDIVYLVYKPKDGDLFSQKSLEAVYGIREEILNYRQKLSEGETSELAHVTRVDTLTSAKILKAEEGALVSRSFIGKNFPKNESEKTILKEEALKQKSFPLFYFSEGFEYGAIVIQTDLGTDRIADTGEEVGFDTDTEFETDELEMEPVGLSETEEEVIEYRPTEMAEYVAFMDAVDEIILKPEYTAQLEYYPVGNPPMMKFFMQQINEMGPVFLAMILAIVLLLWFLFRSLSAVVWSTSIVIISCVLTMGVSGWMGSTLTNMISLTILLILAVGVADAVHIISGYLFFRNKNLNHTEALRSAYGKAALPCLLTTVTTMIGMLTLTFSSIGHIRTFGYMSAMGVMFAFVLTIVVLPLMLDLWAPVRKSMSAQKQKSKKSLFRFKPSELAQKALAKTLPIVEKSPLLVIGVFLVIFLSCIYGATQVKIDSNMVEAAKPGTELRINYEIVDTHMAGTQSMEIYIDGGSTDSLLNPELLKTIDLLQTKIELKYNNLVARTHSLANVVKDAYQVLNEGQERFYVIPDDRTVLTQTLFMFNNANPEDRRRLVSDNYQKTHISVSLYNAGSYEYTDFFNEVQNDIDLAFAGLKSQNSELNVSVTGSLALIMRLADYIGWSQIKSLGGVILIISVIMVFIFGSVRVGFMSIIPNLIPATFTFGSIGLLGLALDSDTIIVAPVIIGIAVDDTIHFITHYRDEVLKSGDINKAIANTIQEVGQAILFTTLILGLGFFMMTFSTNTSFIKVGAFGSMAIFIALLCDLFLLPALILVFKPKFLGRKQKQLLAAAS